jgi:hypothetical protein
VYPISGPSDEPSQGRPLNIELPVIHDAANQASGRGQTRYVRLSATRLISLFVAAIAGAFDVTIGPVDLAGLALMLAFLAAAFAEFTLIKSQPERDWYAGRAIAESTKTLAWRYSVRGEPFGPDLTAKDAEDLLRTRVEEVLVRGKDRITIAGGHPVVTPSMATLREESFETRRDSYLTHRTEDQRNWYANNATKNEHKATKWRYLLLGGELVAVAAAALALGRDEPADFAGIVAAFVAGGAAWLAIKQHSQLTSAYRVAAGELAVQADVLRAVDKQGWPQAVADAEEAISREHTMWLATRGEEPLPPLKGTR